MAKDTYLIANFHLRDNIGRTAVFEDEGAKLISLDEKTVVISSKKYNISTDLIENVFLALVLGNNSRIIFSATPEYSVRDGKEIIYTLNVPQSRKVTLPDGKEYEYTCAPVLKYLEIKKSKNPLGRNSWNPNGDEEEVEAEGGA